jgi:hypothetical protein
VLKPDAEFRQRMEKMVGRFETADLELDAER